MSSPDRPVKPGCLLQFLGGIAAFIGVALISLHKYFVGILLVVLGALLFYGGRSQQRPKK